MLLEIITPEKRIYSGQVKLVQLPGSIGSFEILRNHAPIISTLEKGKIKVEEETGQTLNSGEIRVIPNPATDLITVSFVPKNTGNSKIILSAFDGRKLMEINYGVAEAGKQYWKNINVSNVPNGIYVIQVINGGMIKNEKIIIRR